MKKILFTWVFLLTATAGFCALPILRTSFRGTDLEIVQDQARENNPGAQVELALRYYAGYQVDADAQKAFEWMSSAADLGDPEAMKLLSQMYAEGIGTKTDPAASEVWFARALGSVPDDVQLQEKYEASIAEKKENARELQEFLMLCADAGYAPAYAALKRPEAIELYSQENYQEAQVIFQKLAAGKDPVGMYFLAKMYFLGLGGLPKDDVEAVDLYRKSAEQGSVGAQYELALLYETGTAVETNRAQAEFWFEKAAGKGHSGAQYRLAELKFAEACRRQDAAEVFAENTDVRMHNTGQYKALLSAALEWCRRAADSGNPDAQYLLGRLYASGEGVPRNYDEALHCYEMSAAGKNADAMFYLGMMYHAGLGVPKNPDRAVTLYRQAASAGSRGAMYYLANLYRFGRDIEKNFEKGRDTYRKKALAGVNLPVEDPVQLRDRWILRAALEYGIIQWQDAETDEQKSRARAWVSLAAGGGISGARDVLIGMAPYGEPSSAISETAVNPSADAVEKKRDASILFPCIEEEHRKIYPDFQVLRVLAAVTERGSSMDITGDQPWGLVVEYQSPVIAGSVGLNGVLQIGIEFENVKTGEPYWSFSRIPDEHTVSREDIKTEVSAYFKLSRYPGLRLKGWRVEYGHLFDDGRFVGILDERHKSGTPGTLEEMAFRNRTAEQLPAIVMVTTDLSGINMSAESTEAVMDDSE